MSVYLDYNATTPIEPRVLKAMVEAYQKDIGNADSRTHDFGNDSRKATETARQQVAELIGVKSNEVFFTAGSTESSNIAIQGLDEYAHKTNRFHIVTTTIEHHAVLNTCKEMQRRGYEVDFVECEEDGRVSAEKILEKVRPDTLLVSVMHVNNETGIIQPVKEIGDALYDTQVLFHIDATQSCGKLVDEVRVLKYDMLSLSAHKFRGPQGIGALVLRRKNYKLPPVKGIMFGGQQEHGIRPGTTPVALAVGMGTAAQIAMDEHEQQLHHAQVLKGQLLHQLQDSGVKYLINGNQDYCIPTSISVCFIGVSSEALMIMTKQYCGISNGSACTTLSYEPSYVLRAMGMEDDSINSTVRISWGMDTSKIEFEHAVDELVKTVRMMQ